MCSKNDLYSTEVSEDTEVKEIKTQCIKIDSLRKTYKDKNITLKKWLEIPNNLYVGRRGRIFIDGEIFHYKDSKWRNPYTLKEYSLEDSLKLYKKHVKNSGLYNDLEELEGKTLGCFCDQTGDCHAKTLVKMYRRKKKETSIPETLYRVVKNKRKEIINYYNDFDKESIENFYTFLRYINALMYMDDVLKSGRYSIEDVKAIKIKKDFFKGDMLVNIETFLPYVYEHRLKDDRDEEFFNNLLLKYRGTYVLLLQRVYRDRFETGFKVVEKPDSYFENIIVIGCGEE